MRSAICRHFLELRDRVSLVIGLDPFPSLAGDLNGDAVTGDCLRFETEDIADLARALIARIPADGKLHVLPALIGSESGRAVGLLIFTTASDNRIVLS